MGGILYDLGSHLIDQAVALFGRPALVYGELNRNRPGVAVDDDAFVGLSYADGTRCHLYMSATAAHLGPRFRVLGSQAAYVKHGLDVQEAQLRAGGVPGDPGFGEEPETGWGVLGNVTDGFQPVRTHRGDYQAFYAGVAAAVRDRVDPPVPVQDTLAVLEVVDAARLSARTGDTVRL
jgi:scyllo-inositol 2-dehydrogenase (NADP+)